MAFTAGNKSLTKENVLSRVTSYQLFKTYCSQFTGIDTMFKSEFRIESSPSCHIIQWKGDLLYKDFGSHESYRALDYIMKKFNKNLTEALVMINNDFNLGLGSSKVRGTVSSSGITPVEDTPQNFTDEGNKPTIIKIKSRPWTKADKAYWWDQYGIPSRLLKYHNIKSIERFISISERRTSTFTLTKDMLGYSFDYYWNEGVFRRKLYFPQRKKSRFVSNVDNTIVQGWTLLPKQGNLLIITKSYKDILIFNLLGYWAIAPNSEHSYIPSSVMEKLKKRFTNIIVWFDNDEGGIKGASTFAEKFNLPFTHNPIGGPKDPSDYVKEIGLNSLDLRISTFLKDNDIIR